MGGEGLSSFPPNGAVFITEALLHSIIQFYPVTYFIVDQVSLMRVGKLALTQKLSLFVFPVCLPWLKCHVLPKR